MPNISTAKTIVLVGNTGMNNKTAKAKGNKAMP
jgi:hypothetical protein